MRAIIKNCRNRVRAVRAPLHGPDEPLHGPEKRGDSASLTRRRFAGALGAGAVMAVFGLTRCSPGLSDGSGETNPDPRQTNPDLRQTRKVASVDFRIGGYAEDRSDYLFGQVDGLVLLADGRFIVADRHTRRVTMYSDGGLFISQIGGSGEGPGEFDRASVMAVDPSDRLWVFTYGSRRPQEYVVFSLAERSASFVRSVSVERKTLTSLRPAFGPDGLVGVTVHDVTVHGERLHGRHLWLAENGAIVREHPLPKQATPDELGYLFATMPGPREWRYLHLVVPPFAPDDWLAQAPSGQYARCITSRYEIDLYNADGVRLRQIVRDQLGPQVSAAERRREQFVVDSVKANFPPAFEYPTVPIADRKPPVKYIWYDDDGRLWVQLWEDHGESVARAHVYDGGGDFLFDAEWPLDVSLTNGAIRGDAAVGVALGRFEVPEIVRMTFYAR